MKCHVYILCVCVNISTVNIQTPVIVNVHFFFLVGSSPYSNMRINFKNPFHQISYSSQISFKGHVFTPFLFPSTSLSSFWGQLVAISSCPRSINAFSGHVFLVSAITGTEKQKQDLRVIEHNFVFGDRIVWSLPCQPICSTLAPIKMTLSCFVHNEPLWLEQSILGPLILKSLLTTKDISQHVSMFAVLRFTQNLLLWANRDPGPHMHPWASLPNGFQT